MPQLILIEIGLHYFTLDYPFWIWQNQAYYPSHNQGRSDKDGNRCQKCGNKKTVLINVGEFSKDNSGVSFSG